MGAACGSEAEEKPALAAAKSIAPNHVDTPAKKEETPAATQAAAVVEEKPEVPVKSEAELMKEMKAKRGRTTRVTSKHRERLKKINALKDSMMTSIKVCEGMDITMENASDERKMVDEIAAKQHKTKQEKLARRRAALGASTVYSTLMVGEDASLSNNGVLSAMTSEDKHSLVSDADGSTALGRKRFDESDPGHVLIMKEPLQTSVVRYFTTLVRHLMSILIALLMLLF